ncbi:MAG: chemotaxis protein CheD [Magnetococcales bacterium]|nr:chemotaxis protein CheD [Magnetococcales bacterium]
MSMESSEKDPILLLPDEAYIGNEPDFIITTLDACISVTLHHPRSGTGAIVHSRLPTDPHREERLLLPALGLPFGRDGHCFRYIDSSINRLVRIFRAFGIKTEEILAGIYGGATLRCHEVEMTSLGQKNVAAAMDWLNKYHIVIDRQETGGNMSRRIEFNVVSGEVRVSPLES